MGLCELCEVAGAENFHHLIPRTLHSNKWFKKNYTRAEMQQGLRTCRPCHRAIHDLVPSEKELGRHYNTRDKLRAHPQIAHFIRWKQRRREISNDE